MAKDGLFQLAERLAERDELGRCILETHERGGERLDLGLGQRPESGPRSAQKPRDAPTIQQGVHESRELGVVSKRVVPSKASLERQ